ncbi:hypothetical protein BU23DRAFT_551204 [Bimuria novae-zelandiae CBS 107.79]|uniref:Uncharacterized protein n=1 Tax=Bimuria novae-zelandiae CBS 107.79 TaxID=1447943 RepID=A0A6A5VGQ4_9PLEO|nr:hypothetical protein BU23DRAFT_551204 [Bimuria novae-zelandiae CBS 107.79]
MVDDPSDTPRRVCRRPIICYDDACRIGPCVLADPSRVPENHQELAFISVHWEHLDKWYDIEIPVARLEVRVSWNDEMVRGTVKVLPLLIAKETRPDFSVRFVHSEPPPKQPHRLMNPDEVPPTMGLWEDYQRHVARLNNLMVHDNEIGVSFSREKMAI